MRLTCSAFVKEMNLTYPDIPLQLNFEKIGPWSANRVSTEINKKSLTTEAFAY